jgi:hypothetical protein
MNELNRIIGNVSKRIAFDARDTKEGGSYHSQRFDIYALEVIRTLVDAVSGGYIPEGELLAQMKEYVNECPLAIRLREHK